MKSSLPRVDFCRLNLRTCYALLLLSSYFSSLEACEQCESCTVSAPSGQFRGLAQKSVLTPDIEFCSYRGIPYARPPVNELRFKNPVPLESFTGVYDAVADGNVCIQNAMLDENQMIGDEDCLYLNVYTPKKPRQRPAPLLPVIVFIHGGGFQFGSGTSAEYSPDYLIQHDVIFVAMNYRLSIFGFLDLGTPECGGNMGLRDQTMALEWIRENIQSFGGDPNCVTLAGQSAGAMSAYLLALSPLSRGLFSKLIVMSPVLPNWVNRFVMSDSIKVAYFLGYNGDVGNRREMLHYLQQPDAKQMYYDVVKTYASEVNRTDFKTPARIDTFRPSVDAHLGSGAFLPRSWEELGKETTDIPILVGRTSADGDNFFIYRNVEGFIDYIRNYVVLFLDPIYIGDRKVEAEVVARVREYYFDRPRNIIKDNLLNRVVELMHDLFYFNYYQQGAVFDASYRNNKMYHYEFSYDGSFQFYKRLYLTEEFYRNNSGAAHSEELNCLFYSPKYFPVLTVTQEDEKMIHRMTTWWTNFAKTGNPNAYAGEGWEPISPLQNNYFRIDRESCFIRTRVNEERWQFWDSLPRVVQYPYDYPPDAFSYHNQYTEY